MQLSVILSSDKSFLGVKAIDKHRHEALLLKVSIIFIEN